MFVIPFSNSHDTSTGWDTTLTSTSEQLKYVPIYALPNKGLFLELSVMTLTKNQISTAGGVFTINTAICNNS